MSYPDVSQCVLTGELVGKGAFGSVYRIDCPRSEPDSEDSIWLQGVKTDDRGYFVQKRFDSEDSLQHEKDVIQSLLQACESNEEVKGYVDTLTPIIPQIIQDQLQQRFSKIRRTTCRRQATRLYT